MDSVGNAEAKPPCGVKLGFPKRLRGNPDMKKSSIYVLSLLVLLAILVFINATFAKWLVNGVAVNTSDGDQRSPEAASDGRRGAIIVWRDGGVVAQRVNAFGDLLWNSEGVSLCNGNTKDHTAVANGTGGAIVAWSYRRGKYFEVYIQRLSQAGVPLWSAPGIDICTAQGDKESPRLVSDHAGNFIVVWRDGRGTDGDIYAQKVTEAGDLMWGGTGLPVCTEPGDQEPLGMVTDGSGGVIVAWLDSRGTDIDVYAQRIDGAGTQLWAPSGQPVCAEPGDQERAKAVSDGAGGLIVAWQDSRGPDIDIYAQRIDGAGTQLWAGSSVAASVSPGDQTDPAIAEDDAGGCIITWCDRGGSDVDIRAQRVSAIGAPFWDPAGVTLCSATGDQLQPQIAADGAGGAIVTWNDLRALDENIHAQRISRSGSVKWERNGVAVCNALGDQSTCRIVSDGSSGAIIPWEDARSGGLDIYALRIDGLGRPVLTLLNGYKAYRKNENIVVKWTMARDEGSLHFSILRAPSESGPFRRMLIPIERKGQSFSFVDDSCEPGSGYTYRVEVLLINTREFLFETPVIAIPSRERTRSYNSPNPFNPVTTITYELEARAHVRLEIYDVAGRRIASLVDAARNEGVHQVVWDGRDDNGATVASGIYFYRFTAGDTSESRKLILMR
jgi:hypothetical protein